MTAVVHDKLIADRRTERQLIHLTSRLSDAQINRAVSAIQRQALKPVAEAAKALAPVDTGTYRRSIRIVRAGRAYTITRVVAARRRGSKRPTFQQLLAVEYGTQELPARKVFTRAWEQTGSAAIREFRDGLRDWLEREGRAR